MQQTIDTLVSFTSPCHHLMHPCMRMQSMMYKSSSFLLCKMECQSLGDRCSMHRDHPSWFHLGDSICLWANALGLLNYKPILPSRKKPPDRPGWMMSILTNHQSSIFHLHETSVGYDCSTWRNVKCHIDAVRGPQLFPQDQNASQDDTSPINESLIAKANVYLLADYFQISDLEELAVTKFRAGLKEFEAQGGKYIHI